MIGMVVTLGDLGAEFRASTEFVVGPQRLFETVSIELGELADADATSNAIREALERCDEGEGVIMFTDMFGGTPSNLAIASMASGKYEVVAGMNLPMLIKFVSIREAKGVTMENACAQSQDAGRKYINIATRVLAGADAPPPSRETARAYQRAETRELAAQMKDRIAELDKLLTRMKMQGVGPPGIGHNHPPLDSVINQPTLEEGSIALDVVSEEIKARRTRSASLKLASSVLRRLQELTANLLKWSGEKVDRFANGAIDSTSKAAPFLILCEISTQMHLDLEKLLTMLEHLIK